MLLGRYLTCVCVCAYVCVYLVCGANLLLPPSHLHMLELLLLVDMAPADLVAK